MQKSKKKLLEELKMELEKYTMMMFVLILFMIFNNKFKSKARIRRHEKDKKT